jgi:putative SOS response-associated peptidase YedK
MCNDYRSRMPLEQLIDEFAQLRIPLRFPGGRPNLEPREDIRISERAPVILAEAEGAAALTMARWSWPGPTGKPVFNFRSDGRRFEHGRCLIPADGFYEFTAPADAGAKRKDKWLFTLAGGGPFAIAGLWRAGAAKGEDAWTMLTCAPGPDIAAYHDRQVVVLRPPQWTGWLFGQGNEAALLQPLPAGTLKVERVA